MPLAAFCWINGQQSLAKMPGAFQHHCCDFVHNCPRAATQHPAPLHNIQPRHVPPHRLPKGMQASPEGTRRGSSSPVLKILHLCVALGLSVLHTCVTLLYPPAHSNWAGFVGEPACGVQE